MEPRRRNIEITPFWERGEDSHRKGIRESPVYPLPRLKEAFAGNDTTRPEDLLNQIPNEDADTKREDSGQKQQGLLFES